NKFTFAGKFGVIGISTNLFYMRARYYTSQSGQFLSNDPAGLGAGDVNIRRYVANNAPTAVDPSGLGGTILGPNGLPVGQAGPSIIVPNQPPAHVPAILLPNGTPVPGNAALRQSLNNALHSVKEARSLDGLTKVLEKLNDLADKLGLAQELL